MTEFADLIEPVARRLLGSPSEETANELRFGKRGSLKVSRAGPHKGTFSDFESGTGGGTLDLIARVNGGDRKTAIEWLRREFGDIAGKPENSGGKRIVAVYPYTDEAGEILFEVVRYEPKDFRQRRPDGAGGHSWSIKGVRPVLYRLPDIVEALSFGRTVFIVEGEKDADRLAKIGIAATCNAGGAGKWREEHSQALLGASVVIIPDNDEAGRSHAHQVAKSLHGRAGSTRILEIGGLSRKGDVSEFLDNGGTREELDRMALEAPEWRPRIEMHLPAIRMGEEDKAAPRAWLVKGVLAQGELSVIYAPSGGGKSFFALDLAARIASEMEWFGRPTVGGPVLYLAGEGAAGFRLRMTAWRKRHCEGEPPPFYLIPRALDLRTNAEAAATLADDVESYGKQLGQPVKLIVLDTLSRMLGGGVDAEPRDIAAFLQNVETLREKTGAHICIVHHMGKDKDRGPRGASQIRDVSDTVIEITRPGDGDIFKAQIEKQKDGEDGTTFTYTLAKSVVGIDEDGDEITSCTVEAADANAGGNGSHRRLTDAQEHARRALVDLLASAGAPPRSLGLPASVNAAVLVDAWRQAAYLKPITGSDDQAAKRQAFHRIRSHLLKIGVTCEAGTEGKEWVWLS